MSTAKDNRDLIKALRCLASQKADGFCYEDIYNLTHKNDPEMSCYGLTPGTVKCPYNQKEYDVCFEDGQCSEWLEMAADLLEKLSSAEGGE